MQQLHHFTRPLLVYRVPHPHCICYLSSFDNDHPRRCEIAPQLVGLRGGIWAQAEKAQDIHAWRECFTVFHVLCKPGIMLFCILFFSFNVLLEWLPITLKTIFQAVACVMVCLCCGHSMLNWPWDVPDILFCRRLWGLHSCSFMLVAAFDHRFSIIISSKIAGTKAICIFRTKHLQKDWAKLHS